MSMALGLGLIVLQSLFSLTGLASLHMVNAITMKTQAEKIQVEKVQKEEVKEQVQTEQVKQEEVEEEAWKKMKIFYKFAIGGANEQFD